MAAASIAAAAQFQRVGAPVRIVRAAAWHKPGIQDNKADNLVPQAHTRQDWVADTHSDDDVTIMLRSMAIRNLGMAGDSDTMDKARTMFKTT